MTQNLIFTNIGELVTNHVLADEKRTTGIKHSDLGRIKDAWLAISDGKVRGFGTGKPPAPFHAYKEKSLAGALVLPGLCDSHTHVIFGGNRSEEFMMRLGGATYQEIAASGGGIRSTVNGTRKASDGQLVKLCLDRLSRIASKGTTAIEIKTGYGLSVEEELRLLRILNMIKSKSPLEISVTCLALHALSPEHTSYLEYANEVTRELLPLVAEEKLADSVDVFIEAGYFSVEDSKLYLETAKGLGLNLRIHADEFSDAGAAQIAADLEAKSADHLQFAPESAIKAMAKSGVTATLLPGTSLYTKIPYTSGRKFADLGCPVAVATDFNPGSCYIDNLPLMAALSSLQGGLTPAEAFAGVTFVPACSLGFGEHKGALAEGYDADLVVYHSLKNLDEWFYDFGQSMPSSVWIKGAKI